jgi:septation ring formation regulator EzrA
MMLPSLKHKWVSRLIDSKKQLNSLNKKKKTLKGKVLQTIEGNIPKNIPKAALDLKIESSEHIQNINEEIENCEILIEYLEKVEKIFASMSFDLKTATDLIKMETT